MSININKGVPSQITYDAQLYYLGYGDNFQINNDSQTHDLVGGCLLPNPGQIISIYPQMRKYGTHMKVTQRIFPSLSNRVTLLDEDYNFASQSAYDRTTSFVVNDELAVTCSFKNTGSFPVESGSSILSEKCQASVYAYSTTNAKVVHRPKHDCMSYPF